MELFPEIEQTGKAMVHEKSGKAQGVCADHENEGEKPVSVAFGQRLTPQPVAYGKPRNRVARLGDNITPYLLCGNNLEKLLSIEDNSIDCVITQLPASFDLVKSLTITQEIYRVLKPCGSFWLIIHNDDNPSFQAKLVSLMELEQKWSLVRTVAWQRNEGRGVHISNTTHFILHFAIAKSYFFDDIAFRNAFNRLNNNVKSSSKEKSGKGYRRKIQNSTTLNESEKREALSCLDKALSHQRKGEIVDFRLFLRESHIPVSETSEKGIAINRQGFFLQVNLGATPGNLWNIPVERNKKFKTEVVPKVLAGLLINATCPAGGIVLDPFCSIANVCKVAYTLKRQSIGIDANKELIEDARNDFKQINLKSKQKELSLF